MPVTAQTIRLMRRLVVQLDKVIDRPVTELARSYGAAWDVVRQQLEDALLDLAERDTITATNVMRSSRIASALQAIADQLDDLAAHSAAVITDHTGQVTSLAVEVQAAIAGSQLPRRGQSGIQFDHVNPDVIGSIVARTGQQITARSLPLSQASQVAVRTALLRGAAAADNPTKVARDMVALAGKGAVDLPIARATAIARTELLDASRAATQAWGQANTATLQGWEWLSSRSATTCPACWAQDGTLHELTETGPDGHPNCRCTRLLRTKTWRDLGIDLDEPTGLERATAETAFRALDREQQLYVMGPARLQLLDDGTPWSALATEKHSVEWRRSYVVTPVAALLQVA